METGSVLDAVRSYLSSENSSFSETRCSMLLQTLFVLADHLAEVSVTFALCKHTIVAFCIEPCALL